MYIKNELFSELSQKDKKSENQIFCIDCEMAETSLGMEVTRCSIVDINMNVVYDRLI
jgi:hypothetical protein